MWKGPIGVRCGAVRCTAWDFEFETMMPTSTSQTAVQYHLLSLSEVLIAIDFKFKQVKIVFKKKKLEKKGIPTSAWMCKEEEKLTFTWFQLKCIHHYEASEWESWWVQQYIGRRFVWWFGTINWIYQHDRREERASRLRAQECTIKPPLSLSLSLSRLLQKCIFFLLLLLF